MEKERSLLDRFWLVFLVIIAAAAVLILGVLGITDQKPAIPKVVPTLTPVFEVAPEFERHSPSDEISAIEADLEATDLSELDQELEQIETELATP